MSEERENPNDPRGIDRRGFLKTAGAGVAAAGLMLTPRERALAQATAEKARLDRIARQGTRCRWGRGVEGAKYLYNEVLAAISSPTSVS